MKKTLYIIMVVAAMLASCSTDPDDTGGSSSGGSSGGGDGGGGGDSYEPVEIVFSSSIEAPTQTNANDATQFATNDKIGIIGYCALVAGATTDFSTTPFLNGVEFNYDGSKFTPTTANAAAYWQLDKVHNFYAYYPSTLSINAGSNGIAPFSDISVVAGSGIAGDVMHAKIENTSAFTGTEGNTAKLDFGHKLSKVRFRVLKENAANANPVINKVEFSMAHNKGTYNIITGGVTLSEASAVTLSKTIDQTVTNTTATDVDAEWTVLPTDGISNIKLTIGTKVLTAIVTDGATTTASGKITVITLTIKPSGVEFVSSTLEDWGTATDSDAEVNTPEPIGSKTSAQAIIGDFSFSDGTFGDGTATLSAKQMAACVGIVYWIGNPLTNDKALRRDYPACTHGLIVALTNFKSPWQSQSIAYNKPVNDWTKINATGFTQPVISSTAISDRFNMITGYNNTNAILAFNNAPENSGWKVEAVEKVKDCRAATPAPALSSPWYLPSEKELVLLCGLNNQNENIFPGKDCGTDNRDAMNTQLSKITGSMQINKDYYWSSIEKEYYNSYSVHFSDGDTSHNLSKYDTHDVRCVKAF